MSVIITGKAKDINDLIEKAMLKINEGKGNPGYTFSLKAIVEKLNADYKEIYTGDIDFGYLNTTIWNVSNLLLKTHNVPDAGMNCGAIYLDRLSRFVHEELYETHYGKFNGTRIWKNKKLQYVNSTETRKETSANNRPIAFKTSGRDRKIVRFGIPKYQDTLLAYYFMDAHAPSLYDIKFELFDNSTEASYAFVNDHIDVTLNSFPCAVAYNSLINKKIKSANPLFFWPFFHFNGYVLFAKIASLKKIFNDYSSFRSLDENSQIQFLEKAAILVEKNTDFEWALKEYTKNLGCAEGVINSNINNFATKIAKKEFLKENKFNVYCTNPIHALDIQNSKNANKYEKIVEAHKLVNHRNVNGLICRTNYFHKHKDIVEDIIYNWFAHTDAFRRKLDKIAYPKKSIEIPQLGILKMPGLVKILNDETESNITLGNLPDIYDENFNHFYSDPNIAYDDLYTNMLFDPFDLQDKTIQNNVEITSTLLNHDNVNEEEIRKIISSIKQNMTK